jgi:hypothetical protein
VNRLRRLIVAAPAAFVLVAIGGSQLAGPARETLEMLIRLALKSSDVDSKRFTDQVRPSASESGTRTTLLTVAVESSGATLFVSPNGSPTGLGDRPAPLDLATGLDRLQPGDTLILIDGIYRVEAGHELFLGSRSSVARASILADAGARPIIVTSDGTAPVVHFGDNTRVAGLWFGGTPNPEDEQGVTLGNDNDIVANTFFGYFGAINEGAQTRNVIRDNRFVNTGHGPYYHAVYINNSSARPGEGALIDGNVFVGGGGYATHLWHNPTHVTVSGNFYGDVERAIVAQGEDILCERNVIWSSRGETWEGLPIGPTLFFPRGSSFVFRNNLIGARNLPPTIEIPVAPAAVISGNAFVKGGRTFGDSPRILGPDELLQSLGVSGNELDAAVAALETAFQTDVTGIHANPDIERHFDTLRQALSAWSQLR